MLTYFYYRWRKHNCFTKFYCSWPSWMRKLSITLQYLTICRDSL